MVLITFYLVVRRDLIRSFLNTGNQLSGLRRLTAPIGRELCGVFMSCCRRLIRLGLCVSAAWLSETSWSLSVWYAIYKCAYVLVY